jgi:DNA-binding LytR/AlgR family response regulator
MGELAVIVCLAFDHRASTARLAKFKDLVSHSDFVEAVIEVCGTFDLIVQGRCSCLAEYNENLARLRDEAAECVCRLESNFVAKRLETKHDHDDAGALWLPCDGGRKRVEAKLIDKVIAEGDYMRVHVGSWNCLVHHTMQKLSEQLGEAGFIKLHRSCLVRIEFIERLVHEERRWKIRLRDGTHVSVARSHVPQVLRLIAGESSNNQRASSKLKGVTESSAHLAEKPVLSMQLEEH